MDLLDVNVLVNAFRRDAPRHAEFLAYVRSLVENNLPYAIPSTVFSGFFRIITHPSIFNPPSKFVDALTFAEQVRSPSHCLTIVPGSTHWGIFVELCTKGGARGGLISDAYLAAMAIEIGAELVTDDRGFGRWPGLRWRHPVDG
ncbi:MAG TPA: type II toxin-antitoxin system VapC family toxin [Lacipirellulaceae bacterium]|nr:type II toxin-antitoxin system VapC family toxin [Lacipirellulaceae bacterium]